MMINNQNSNNNNNRIYIFYKLIFNNKYLLKKIYKYVRGLNREICESDINNKSITKRLRYHEITSFDWMIKNNHFQLLYDKILSNNSSLQFRNINNLKIFLKQTNLKNEILYKFNQIYKSSYNHLITKKNLKYQIIELSIECQNFEFLKIVYNDYLNQQAEQVQQQTKNDEKEDSIKNEKSILLNALKYGNIEIIKYVNQVIGIKFMNHNQAATISGNENSINFLMNAVESENRENVLIYLLDDLNLKFKNIQSSCIYTTGSFYFFYINLLNLNFKTFKRLVEKEFDIVNNGDGGLNFFKGLIFPKILEVYNTPIRKYLNYLELEKSITSKTITFDKFLNFFQIIIYISYLIDSKKEKYNEILNQLNTHSMSISTCGINNNTVDYNKREITRIILFDFIYNIKECILSNNEECIILLVNYTRKFKQYSFLKQYIERGRIEKSIFLSDQILRESLKHADCKLFEILIDCNIKISSFGYFSEISSIEYFDPNLISKEQQIRYIGTLFKHGQHINNFEIMCGLLGIFFKQKQLEIIDSILIGEILKNYLLLQSINQRISSIILVGAPISIFKFYFLNYNQLFIWDETTIGLEVIENGSLDLIEFIFENKIGSLNLNRSLNFTKTKSVAKFMYDHLGFRFNDQLVLISKLNEWKSEYLFTFAINCLIKSNFQNKNKKTNIIMVHGCCEFNYKRMNYIQSLCLEGRINSGRFFVDATPIYKLFPNLKDYQYIKNTCNLKIIYNFLKNENLLATDDNEKLYNEINKNVTSRYSDFGSSSDDINLLDHIKNYFKNKLNK